MKNRVQNFVGRVKNYVASPLTLTQQNGYHELTLYDFIDPYWGISADAVTKALAGQTIERLVVRINSPGGDVFEGWTIYNFLKSRSYPVETVVDGSAASIASVIMLAGSVVKAAEHSLVMIHNPWMMVMGSSADLRSAADLLDKIKGDLVAVYAAKTGMSEADIGLLMDSETWMNAEEAKNFKFIDDVIPDNPPQEAKASAFASAHAAALSQFYNKDIPKLSVPEDVNPRHVEEPVNDRMRLRARAQLMLAEHL